MEGKGTFLLPAQSLYLVEVLFGEHLWTLLSHDMYVYHLFFVLQFDLFPSQKTTVIQAICLNFVLIHNLLINIACNFSVCGY